MSYALQTDLEDAAGGAERFRELADWDGDGTPDTAVVSRAQASAEEWIDETIKSRYSVPLTNPSPELRELAAAETIYRIRSKRGQVSELDVKQHEERMTMLGEYRNGLRRPGVPDEVRSMQGRSVIITSADAGASVSRDKLKGMW